MNSVARRSLTILGVAVALFCAVMASSALFTRRKAKVLIDDLKRLDAAADPTSVFRSFQQKHGDEFPREKCIADKCYYELVIRNRVLSTFHLAPRTEIRTYFTLYRGSLGMLNVEYTSAVFKQNSPIVGLQEAFCSVECDGFYLNPHGRDVGPVWNGSVAFGQKSTPDQKQAAFALNLTCLAAFGGCKDISELLPSLWKRTSPGAVSSRVRSNSDSTAETSQPLPE